MISVCFQGKPSNITVIQVYAPTVNTEEAAVEQSYEDPLDLLELSTKKKKKKKDILFIIEDWNTKAMYMYIVNSMCRCVYLYVGMHMHIHVYAHVCEHIHICVYVSIYTSYVYSVCFCV